MFARLMANLQRRGRILRTHLLLFRRWLLRQYHDVQAAVILIIVNTIICGVLVKVTESHLPAMIGMLVTYSLYLYIVRKLAFPLWQAELLMVVWRRATGLLPRWLRRFVTATSSEPHGTTHSNGVHEQHEPETVWYDVSVGGNVFHVISTVCMWSEVFLYTCAILPAWTAMTQVVVTTIMILFFVSTEEFVDIKKWRRRLAYVVTIQAITLLVPLTIRALDPAYYNYLVAKFQYHETMSNQAAREIQVRIANDRYWLDEFNARERNLVNQKRTANLAGDTWTAATVEQKLQRVRLQRTEIAADLAALESQNQTSVSSWFRLNAKNRMTLTLFIGLIGVALITLG